MKEPVMDALSVAGHFAKRSGPMPPAPKSIEAYYEEYKPNPLRHLLPLISAVGAVGVWLVVLGLIPR
jgi:hypothetical protein